MDAIFREDHAIVPDRDTRIEPGDEVFRLAPSTHLRIAPSDLRRTDRPVKRIMIAGGGNIGLRLARPRRRRLGDDHRAGT